MVSDRQSDSTCFRASSRPKPRSGSMALLPHFTDQGKSQGQPRVKENWQPRHTRSSGRPIKNRRTQWQHSLAAIYANIPYQFNLTLQPASSWLLTNVFWAQILTQLKSSMYACWIHSSSLCHISLHERNLFCARNCASPGTASAKSASAPSSPLNEMNNTGWVVFKIQAQMHSSSSSSRELARHANSQASPRPTESDTLWLETSMQWIWKFENHSLRQQE